MSENTVVSIPEPTGDTIANPQGSKRAVVILGSGRSGTSLCAKILSQLGIAMEATLQRPNEMNPEGYFEDTRLIEINKRLLDKLSPVPDVAPSSDVAAAKIEPEMKELRAHLRERTSAASGVWGFKDPRVSTLLPLYRRAFQAEGIIPHYIFCARSADAIVESLLQVSTKSRALCEQIYFVRTFLALRDCAANCYVLHYEKLQENPPEQIKDLWNYISAYNAPFPLQDNECKELVNKKFDRASLRASPISNSLAIQMSELLYQMDGAEFDREVIFDGLKRIDAAHSAYQIWIDLMVNRINTMKLASSTVKQDSTKKEQETAARCAAAEARAKESEASLSQIQKEYNKKQLELKKQTDCVQSLSDELALLQAKTSRLENERDAAITIARSKGSALKASPNGLNQPETTDPGHLETKVARFHRNEKRLKANSEQLWQKLQQTNRELKDTKAQLRVANDEITHLSNSVRYRAGTFVVDALKQPGWRTLVLPWRMARLYPGKKRD